MSEISQESLMVLDGISRSGIATRIDELVLPLLNDEQAQEYQKLRRSEALYEQALEAQVPFSWDTAFEQGWLCRHDFEVFPELSGRTYQEALEAHRQKRQ